ncbi:hypothetical protein [Kaarinaea lacus]
MNPSQSLIRLETLLKAWPSDNFPDIVKQEIEKLDVSMLPLQQGLSQGNYVTDEKINVMVISVTSEESSILVKTGIFYSSVIAGCNCADDPTPVDTLPEYCVVQFDINKITADTSVQLITES